MESKSPNQKSLTLYTTLQALTLVCCWGWFAALWSIATFGYTLGDFEWWVLVIAAFAGLYGLRPNLERAIDTAWLQGINSSTALGERIAQLRPIKRRIDFIFSVVVIILLALAVALWLFGTFVLGDGGGKA